MSKHAKLLERVLLGTADANIPFDGLCRLLQRLSFQMRVRGSHHIFSREAVEEILNLQTQRRECQIVSGKTGAERHFKV